MYDDGRAGAGEERHAALAVSSTTTGSHRIRRFFHRWRPGDLDKAGAYFLRLFFFFSIGPGRVSSRGTRKNAARSVSVWQSGGTPRLVTIAGCGRRLIGGRRKNLFREKLTSSGQSTCSRDLPLSSHFFSDYARTPRTMNPALYRRINAIKAVASGPQCYA